MEGEEGGCFPAKCCPPCPFNKTAELSCSSHRNLSTSISDPCANCNYSSQKLAAYDEDAELSVTTLLDLPTCNGRIGATGMCLGGHLAYRCALDSRVAATVCYFATDIHSHGLGEGKQDDSLGRAGDIKGELVMVCGLKGRRVIFREGKTDLEGSEDRYLGRVSL